MEKRRMRLLSLTVALLVLAPTAACNTPSLDEYEAHTGIITGTVVYNEGTPSADTCTPSPVRGNVVVLLFDEQDLPPPDGTGTPRNFVVVPREKLFGQVTGESGGALFAAPYTMPTVPAGRYQVRAFLDSDEDFNPTVDLLAQPTAGDVVGGFVDLMTGSFATVEVAADQVVSQVVVSLARSLPAERPAFAFSSTTTFSGLGPFSLRLASHAVERGPITMAPECTRFLVRYMDADGDGQPDDLDGDHLPDVYPRVFFQRSLEDAAGSSRIIVPAAVNPLPFVEGLATSAGAQGVFAQELEVLIPGVALRVSSDGTIEETLSQVPAGDYDTVLVSATGQTWTVPNDLNDLPLEEPIDATQAEHVTWLDTRALSGVIHGSLHVAAADPSDVFVFAYDARFPPPPTGRGRPVMATFLSRSAMTELSAGTWGADFALTNLADGSYLVTAIADLDRNLSPVVPFLSQPSLGDLGGVGLGPVAVSSSSPAWTGVIEVAAPFVSDPPIFDFSSVSLRQMDLPATLKLRSRAIDAIGVSVEGARVPVALVGGDSNQDGLPDLYPKVSLTLMSSAGDARLATDNGNIVLPAVIDPLPFMASLSAGNAFVMTDELRLLLPREVVDLGTGNRSQLVPAGRYRVNVVLKSGQTWSVPNDLDIALGRDPAAAPDQASVVDVLDAAVPGGVVTGEIVSQVALPTSSFRVVVAAYDVSRGDYPRGDRVPAATSIIPGERFGLTSRAAYRLTGLDTGTYQVVAFLDVQNDFVPWFKVMGQANANDVGGGYYAPGEEASSVPRLGSIQVHALGAPVTGVDLLLLASQRFLTDPPAFALASEVQLHSTSASALATLVGLNADLGTWSVAGSFEVGWFDRDGDGVKDDVDGDGSADLFPIVVADLLDPDDGDHLRLASDRVRIRGVIDTSSFPSLDPATHPVVNADELTVRFPAEARRLSSPSTVIQPPAGRYKITVVNARGQVWSSPNDLARAAGTSFGATQDRGLTVSE